MEQRTVAARLENIVKIFPPSNVAVDNVTLDIFEGEIHSIIGENGAGKSTLMKVLYALEKPDAGSIYLNGKKVHFKSPQNAVANGIGMVHQEFMLIPKYSILQNIILGYETTNAFDVIDKKKSLEKYYEAAKAINFAAEPDRLIETCSVAIQQKIEIIKQLYRNVNLLILDEPTAVLTPQEVDDFFKMVRQLKEKGKTIIFISHKLDEILDISDRITVMRQGSLIWSKDNKNLSKQDLAEAMVGRSVVFMTQKNKIEPGDAVLEISDLTVTSTVQSEKKLLNQVSFTVREKEIVGVAAVEGNGQYELVQTIIGNLLPDSGTVRVSGADITRASIRKRRENIAYISQDRKKSSSSQNSSIVANSIMTHHYLNKNLLGKFGLMGKKTVSNFTKNIIQKFNVVAVNKNVKISSLSGGNQQKVIVGREFELSAPLLLLDQPVRGLDVGSIEYIHQQIINKRDAGIAVLLVSADLDELFSLSDRIIVMYKGSIAAQFNASETNKTEVGAYMLGSKGAVN